MPSCTCALGHKGSVLIPAPCHDSSTVSLKLRDTATALFVCRFGAQRHSAVSQLDAAVCNSAQPKGACLAKDIQWGMYSGLLPLFTCYASHSCIRGVSGCFITWVIGVNLCTSGQPILVP